MDESFAGLRRYVNAAVRQPDFAVVRGRARRLRRRRTVITGAVTAVLVLLGLGYAARSAPHRHDQPARPLPSASGQPGDPSVLNYRDQVFAGGPHDLYTLHGRCRWCADELFASTDDGATWQARTLPPAPAGEIDEDRDPHVEALGPGILAWGDHPLDKSWRSAEPVYPFQWVSTDGGVSWQRAAIDATPVAAVPPGTALVGCGSIGRLSPCRVYAVHPDTGRFAPLAVQPSGITLTDAAFNQAQVPIGAGLYVPGLDRAGRRAAVASSTDGGRTWRTSVLPGAVAARYSDAQVILPYVTAGAAGTAYADVPRERSWGLLYRTTDGGRTWQKTRARGSSGNGHVTPDGAYIQPSPASDMNSYQVTRDGTPFEPITLPGLIRGVAATYFRQPVIGVYVAPDLPSSLYLSPDGISWRRIEVP